MLLGNWIWRLPVEVNSIWVMVIESTQGLGANGWGANLASKASSRSPWRAIHKIQGSFCEQKHVSVSNGVVQLS